LKCGQIKTEFVGKHAFGPNATNEILSQIYPKYQKVSTCYISADLQEINSQCATRDTGYFFYRCNEQGSFIA
jgi:hypothetical protein